MPPLAEQIEAARALHAQGRLDDADAAYRRILDAHPESAEAHYRHANVSKDRGDLQAALAAYDRAVALKPDHAHAWCNRAVVLGQVGRPLESLHSYDQALEADPSDALAYCNRGYLLLSLGQKDAALASFDAAIARRPGYFPAHFARGALLQERQEWPAALDSYDRAITLHAGHALTHYNRGTVQRALGRWHEALAGFDHAIALDPVFAPAHAGRAEALQKLRRPPEALAAYDRALELNPEDAKNHGNRGVLLQEMQQFDAAMMAYDRAIALDPASAEAHFNRGTLLKASDDLEGAIAAYDRAIAAKPRYAEAHVNRGTALQELGRLGEAIASYRQAVLLDPDLAEGHYNLALTSLKAGDYDTGWKHHEWRWRARSGPVHRETRHFAEPLWLGGQSIADETILLYGEQGFGDSLQFCRYVPMVAALGARVILEVPLPLVEICKTLQGVTEVVPFGSALPHFARQCPLLSLPLAFGTTLENLPATAGYLQSDTRKVRAWEQRLGTKHKPRIGLVWSGNQTSVPYRKRHFPLSTFIPYLCDRFQYVCLQTDITEFDRATLSRYPAIASFATELQDFSDTAALAECMDLIVSVDTSVAHLGGALGKKTWVVLAFDADWRWLTDREDSPWYPTMRLYRQRLRGDWNAVFEQVAADWAKEFSRR